MSTKKKNITLNDLATTIDNLARMTAKGFSDVLEGVASKEDFRRLEVDMVTIKTELGSVRYDVNQIKNILGPLVQVVNSDRAEINDLKSRVSKLEHKVGLTK